MLLPKKVKNFERKFHRLSGCSKPFNTDCPLFQKKTNKKADNLWYTTLFYALNQSAGRVFGIAQADERYL